MSTTEHADTEASAVPTRGTRPQFTVECAHLTRALAYVAKALPTYGHAAPVLNGVMLTADAGTDTLTLTCTDGDHARTVTIAACVSDSGSTLVGADLLIRIAKLLAEGPIAFSDNGRDLHIVWNATNYWLPTLPELDFPAPAQLPPVIGTVDVATLKAVLARVKPTIGTPSAKNHIPGFEGVYFVPVGDTLTLTGCDRFRASLVDVAWSNTSGCATPFNVPGRELVEALDAFAAELGTAGGTVELRQGDGWFALVSGRYALSIPTLTADVHAGVKAVFKAGVRQAHAACNAAELSKAIETVSKVAGKKAPVRLVWTAATVSVESTDTDCPASIAVACQFAGVHGFSVNVVPGYLKQGLAAVKASSPLFAFRTNNAPFELSAPTLAGDTFRYVMSPIRQHGDDVQAHDPGSTVEVAPVAEPAKAPPRARKATKARDTTPEPVAAPTPVDPDPWAELAGQLGIAPAYV